MRLLGLFCILLLLIGCPPKEPSQPSAPPVTQAPTEDKFDRFGQVMGNEDAFYYELKRLQGKHTSTPSFSGINLGNTSQQYDLSSKIEDGKVGFGITDNQSGEEWVLWGWHQTGKQIANLKVIKDTPTSNGYTIEISYSENSLNLRLVARWEQDRFLFVSRELMLGGLDHEWRVPVSCTSWQIAGRWLPYRMVPSNQGPYGVLKESEADGAWHNRHYPQSAMVPAVAAFDRFHGVLLSVVDEHPRKLDRTYSMSWKVASDYAYGPVINLGHKSYDSINDTYNEPYIVSGLPYRDSIVVELFELNNQSLDPSLVEAETAEVISHLAAITRAYHFVPEPSRSTNNGCVINLSDWLSDDDKQVKFIHKINDNWDVIGSRFDLGDLAPPPDQDNVENSNDELTGLAEWESEGLNGYVSASSIIETMPEGISYPPLPDVRVAGASAKLARGITEGLDGLPKTFGVAFENPFAVGQLVSIDQAKIRFCSNQIAAAVITGYVAEQLFESGRHCSMEGGLALGLPVTDSSYLWSDPLFGLDASGELDTDTVILNNRMASLVAWSVFGIKPLVNSSNGGLATEIIATTPYVSGHFIGKQLEMYYGFEEFVEHQPDLRASAAQIKVIHSSPESSGYLSGGERPAQCDELVTVMPGDLQGSSSVWIAFFGTGGSITVDEYNFITVNWGDFGYWRDKLPGGYWVVMHPDPENIVAGDAVLIKRSPILPGSSPNTNQG